MVAPNNKYDIDWKKVDDLLIAGCTITDIAGYFGCDRDILYIRFQKEKGSSLSAYAQQKRLKGDSLLRAHQYAKALGLTDKGDNTLLIWLGKVRLKQKEEVSMSESDHKAVASIVAQINNAQGVPEAPLSTDKESTKP